MSIKNTKYKDKNGEKIFVGDNVWFENELYEVYKKIVPFNHFVIDNDIKMFQLSEVHDKCIKK